MLQNILIVEDEPDIAESLKYNFEREGFRVLIAESGEKGLRLALDEQVSPSLMILDLMLPGMSGLELCRRLRREPATRKTPIIMLTAKVTEADKIAGLEIGADDYIVKPFSVKEVVARVRAVLRRTDEGSVKRYEDDKLVIDFEDIRVLCSGQEVKLTRKEFALLTNLAKMWRVLPAKICSTMFGDTLFRRYANSMFTSAVCGKNSAIAAIVLKQSSGSDIVLSE